MDFKRKRILDFLQWVDKNGSYTDENCKIDGVEKITYKEAVKHFFGFINEDVYCRYADNIFELSYDEVIQIARNIGVLDKTLNLLNEVEVSSEPTIAFYKSIIK